VRVAQIMLARGFGGAERSFFDLTNELANSGHKVMVILDSRSVLFPRFENNKRVLTVPLRCHGAWDLLAQNKIKRSLENFGAEIMHAHLARSACIGGKAARALCITSVVKTHNLVNLKYYKSIDHFVPTTNAQVEYLLNNGIKEKYITKIPNFTRLDPVVSVAIQDQREPFVIRAVGRLVRKKGFDILISAMKVVREKKISVRLELGGTGPEYKKLIKQVATNNLQEAVTFCGWIEDVQSFVNGADLFVVPSREEPFGIVVLESMASGVPIIVSRTQGPLEILTDEMGYFCELDSPLSMAEKIVEALSSSDRWHKAQVALEKLKTTYTPVQVVRQYERLYERLI